MGIVDEFLELKEETDADLLAMQVGDFYEFFAEDARIVSNEIGLKMSEKSSHGSSYPMAGVPIEDLEQYTKTLVEQKGFTVAVADQYEENGNHKREIVRKVTPGTILESVEGESRYLSSVLVKGDSVGLAFTDVSSGQILIKESSVDEFLNDISVYRPVEILLSTTSVSDEKISSMKSEIENYMNTRIQIKDYNIGQDKLEKRVNGHFGSDILESIGVDENAVCIASAGIILDYLEDSIPKVRDSITQLRLVGDEEYVRMDARTRRSLELVDTISNEAGESLFDVMDRTVTSNGRDKLRRYIQRPLNSKEKVMQRQESVSRLVKSAMARREIRSILEEIPNLPRIASRASYGNAKPREISQIVDGLEAVDRIKDTINRSNNLSGSPIARRIENLNHNEIKRISRLIDSALVDDPPNTVDKGLISRGYDNDLDEVIRKHEENKNWFESLEEQVKSEYEITHVTVDRNMTDGFYVQVGKSEADEISREEYEHFKSLKNSERFKNDKIREREREFLRLEERREDMEKEVFDKLLDDISQNAETIQSVGETIAHIDALVSLATHAVKNEWTEPSISDERGINIRSGRHPVVEQNTDFVPNDTNLGFGCDFTIVTGPNMAGKSTYLRQTALIVLLAQVGSYVPAESAEIGVVDGIYTRVGAMDEISRGRSTFMVEMSELANILHSSTDDSLVILDEVGRGTATYDGISIAKSTIEYLVSRKNNFQTPLTLFATHYHELTNMADDYENLCNVHVAVKSGESREDYEFVRKVRDGSADKSYGIRVADIAGVPDPVIDRSEDILDDLREKD